MIPGGKLEKRPYEEYPEVSEMNGEDYKVWQTLNLAQKKLYDFFVNILGINYPLTKFKNNYSYVKTFDDTDRTVANLEVDNAAHNYIMKYYVNKKRKQKIGDKRLQREIDDIKEVLGKAKLPVPNKYRKSENKKLEGVAKNMKPVFRKKKVNKKRVKCGCNK